MAENKTEQSMVLVPQQTEYEGLIMVVSPTEALRRLNELQAFVKTVMKPGIDNDYAVIPGTKKKTLLQPGAQKLCEVYGLATHYEDVEVTENWDKPLFFYRKRCVVTSRRDGRFICDGIGSCNSKEDRYAWRWINEEDIPESIDKSTLKRKSQETQRGLWVQYRMPNEDVCSLVNTIEKMACKRALVHAVQGATRSADLFTQDLLKEDVPAEAYGEAAPTRSWEGEDRRTEAEKVHGFTERLNGAADEPAINSIAAELAKSDLPMSAGAPLRKLVQERIVAIRAEAKRQKSAATPEAPKDQPPPQEAPPQYDPHGDPEPPRRGAK